MTPNRSEADGESRPRPAVIVIAAGRGTRMKSRLPKVLHRISDRPIVNHVLETVRLTGFGPTAVVVGYGAGDVRAACGDGWLFAEQTEQLGTGHAVQQGLPLLPECSEIVVVYGECPLVQTDTLTRLVAAHRDAKAAMTIATGTADDPTGLGRIVRDSSGRIREIIEEAVATPAQRSIRETNGGLYCFDTAWLRRELPLLPLRPKGEFYLTDLLQVAVKSGLAVASIDAPSLEITGINDRTHLALAEAEMRRRINRRLMLSGVTIVDPDTTYIGASVVIGVDTVVHPNTHMSGATEVGEECAIGPNSHVVDSRVGAGSRIWASVVESSVVESGVRIGPYSHLRPGSVVETGANVGNFAEIKNSRVGGGTQVHHFSYLGDAEIGRNVNVGAGSITCNYDSETGEKSRTVIEDGVSLGSDTMLVSPVRLGAGSRTGAGAVVTRDVEPETLVIGAPARPLRALKKKR